MVFKVYKITNIISGSIYIGMTKNKLERRFWEHKNCSRKSPLYDAMKSYGVENFVIELISSWETREACATEEKRLISELRSTNQLYNLADGGSGGFVIQDIESWKMKLKEKRKGRQPAKGMSHSEDTKKKCFKASEEYWKDKRKYENDIEAILALSFSEAKQLYGISTTHYYRLKKRATQQDKSNELV
jgi:group I intron endonuclease